VDGVKYLDHKQCNVVFSKDSDAYGQTNIGAMLPCSRWNSNFEAQIDYDILPDGSEKDNTEATSDEKRGSNGKIGAGVDVALRPVGVPPVSTLGVGPPCAKSFQINRMRWRSKDQRAGVEHVGERARITFRVGRNFGKRPVAAGAHEFFELPVCYRSAVDPEAAEADCLGRRWRHTMNEQKARYNS
jgi:hypothetical protein